MIEDSSKILHKVSSTIDNYYSGYLEMDMGYKFRTREFLNVIFLYTNSVDVRNPDILGRNNRNTFVYEAQSQIEKIKEQVRLDIKDINFIIDGASSLGRFIPKAANRKILEENDFDEVMDEIPDNAVDYGSGFLKVWEHKKKLKMKSIDPYYMIFNQYDFKGGYKIEKFRKTVREVIENKNYDSQETAKLVRKYRQDELDTDLVLYQATQDLPDGSQTIHIVDLVNDLVYYSNTTKEKMVYYYKFDYKKRKGFPDALGVGCNEKVFNKLVQSKVNRERMDKVMEIASKLPFQKQVDNELDSMVGKEVIHLENGVILGHKGNPIQTLDTGGIKQANMITAQINSIIGTIGNDLNVSEALQGNTLPSGTSGVLGNLLTENSSSVLKEVKKNYAKFLNVVYKSSIIPYILQVFDSTDDLRKYLEPNDIKLIEKSVINYLVAQKQVDAAINDVPFNVGVATEQVKNEIKRQGLISGQLLDTLREEINGIRTYISGENISKAQIVAFLREVRATYASNPQLFQDPFFIETLKKEAEYDSGISSVEIDNLLSEIVAPEPQQPVEQV